MLDSAKLSLVENILRRDLGMFELATASGGTYVIYDSDNVTYDDLNMDTLSFMVDKRKISDISNNETVSVLIYVNGTPAVSCFATVAEKEV